MQWKINIRMRGLIFAAMVCLFYISVLPSDFAAMKYIDDILPLIMGGFWWIHMFRVPKTTDTGAIFLLLIAICIIGLLSNYASNLTGFMPAVLDMFSFIKMFLVFLGTCGILYGRERVLDQAVLYLCWIAKLFLIVGFVFAIMNLTGLVSMYDGLRFGFKNYHFIYGNASQYGILVGVALAFIIFSEEENIWIYEVMALVTMILTMKGMSLIIAAVYICLCLLSPRRIKIWQLMLIGVVLLVVLRWQIVYYLMDETAPRAILLRNGARIANDFFPLGGGFATFGSEMSGRYYSPLYMLYGMSNRAAFIYDNPTGCYINDTYLGMVMGQFGWIGTILLLLIFIIIVRKLLRTQAPCRRAQYIVLGLFACFCGMAIMAGSIKGAPGQLILLVIQIYFLKYGNTAQVNRSVEE